MSANPGPVPAIGEQTKTLIRMAVREDMGWGDATVKLVIPHDHQSAATIVARKKGTLAGTYLLSAILEEYDPDKKVQCEVVARDRSRVEPGNPIAHLTGPTGIILSAERVLLNFLGHLCGIATLTRQYVDAIADIHSTAGGKPPAICDTRKTTPGFRLLDKYAVRCGGGQNYRMGLYDGVMLKDNHLAALRNTLGPGNTLADLVEHAREELSPDIPLCLEVDTLEQFKEALDADGAGPDHGADVILLDNFTPPQMKQAVDIRNRFGHRPLLEASGGITLHNLRDVAATGIDRISIGALTHSAPTLDISMDFSAP